MTRKELFMFGFSTAFLYTLQLSVGKEVTRAQKDTLNGVQRRNTQLSAERLLDDRRKAPR